MVGSSFIARNFPSSNASTSGDLGVFGNGEGGRDVQMCHDVSFEEAKFYQQGEANKLGHLLN